MKLYKTLYQPNDPDYGSEPLTLADLYARQSVLDPSIRLHVITPSGGGNSIVYRGNNKIATALTPDPWEVLPSLLDDLRAAKYALLATQEPLIPVERPEKITSFWQLQDYLELESLYEKADRTRREAEKGMAETRSHLYFSIKQCIMDVCLVSIPLTIGDYTLQMYADASEDKGLRLHIEYKGERI